MMNDEMVTKALVQSVQEVFSNTLSTPCEIKEGDATHSADQLICFIGIGGDLEGNLALHVPQKAACAIVSKMLFMDIAEMTQDVRDGVGEMLNMIAGGIKMKVQSASGSVNISLPTVIEGSGMQIKVKADNQRVAKQVVFEGHSFMADFIYKINGKKS